VKQAGAKYVGPGADRSLNAEKLAFGNFQSAFFAESKSMGELSPPYRHISRGERRLSVGVNA
jgi:hypothetical protein